MHEGSRRASDINPHAIPIEKIPRKIPQTKPTPPDKSHTTGQVFFQIRMNPTPPDHSDRLQPPHNPSVVGSIPTGPTMPHIRPQKGKVLVPKRADFPVEQGTFGALHERRSKKNWIELTTFQSSQEPPFRASSAAKSHVLSHALDKEKIVASCRAMEQCCVGPGHKVVPRH